MIPKHFLSRTGRGGQVIRVQMLVCGGVSNQEKKTFSVFLVGKAVFKVSSMVNTVPWKSSGWPLTTVGGDSGEKKKDGNSVVSGSIQLSREKTEEQREIREGKNKRHVESRTKPGGEKGPETEKHKTQGGGPGRHTPRRPHANGARR